MVTQSFTGHTASQTPHPQHACIFASYRPSGGTSKQESGHCSQHSVHLMQVSKSTTGRMVRVLNFLNVGLRSGWKPPTCWVAEFSIWWPRGMAGMVTPSRISHHLGNTNLYSSFGSPWLGSTGTVVIAPLEDPPQGPFSSSLHLHRPSCCSHFILR